MVHNARVPHAGRNFETFGEDPFLASRIAASEVQAIQDAGLIATVKAYAANNQEDNRLGVDVNAGEQTLHEIELAGFEAAVDAGAGGVMCAYNQVNGAYSCENSALAHRHSAHPVGLQGPRYDRLVRQPSGRRQRAGSRAGP